MVSQAFSRPSDSNDAGAFHSMYLTHYKSVTDAARRVVGNAAIAEEIAQGGFMHVWQSFDAYDPTRGPVGSYLRVIARNRAVDSLRSTSAQARRELRLASSNRDDNDDHEALVRIEQRLVWQALAELPIINRQPIVLAHFGAMTYREVAAHLELPEGTVKSRIRLGMQLLSQQLNDHRTSREPPHPVI